MVTAESLVIGDDMESDNDTDLGGLLEKAREGDMVAIGQFVRVVDAPLRHYCYSLTRDKHLADDLFQDTILAVLENLHTFRSDRKYAAWRWLFKITLNTFVTKKRTKAAQISLLTPEAIAGLASQEPTQSQLVEKADTAARVWALLGKLPAKQRDVILLRSGGMSYDKIAEVLGKPLGTVSTLFNRGVARLREKFEDEERGPDAA